jgi:hypothetical protein
MLNPLGGEAVLVIPTDDSPSSQYIRLHEMMHCAHSPISPPTDLPREKGPPIQGHNIYIMEELRINFIIRYKMGKNWVAARELLTPDDIDNLMKSFLVRFRPEDLQDMLDLHVNLWTTTDKELYSGHTWITEWLLDQAEIARSSGDTDEAIFLGRLETLMLHVTIQIWNSQFWEGFIELGDGKIPGWKDRLLPLADWYDKVKRSLPNVQPKLDPRLQRGPGEGVPEDLKKLAGGLMPTSVQRSIDMEVNKAEWTGKKSVIKPYYEEAEVTWGRMEVKFPKLRNKLKGKQRTKSRITASDAGTVPNQIHRMLVDGQVFGRKRNEPGGSVLIDDSGSMNWTNQQMNDIVLAAPAVIIGAYSGMSREGELKVIAKDGYWNPNERPAGGNNIVDYPAIEWLSKQPEPRIWVTDSQVIPVTGDMEEAKRECLAFCLKHNINVVTSVDHAAEVFQGKRLLFR